jgi:hypothetical protein
VCVCVCSAGTVRRDGSAAGAVPEREEACPRWDLVSVQQEARPAGFSPFGLAATADAGAAADRPISRDPTSIEEGLRPEAPRFDFQIPG